MRLIKTFHKRLFSPDLE